MLIKFPTPIKLKGMALDEIDTNHLIFYDGQIVVNPSNGVMPVTIPVPELTKPAGQALTVLLNAIVPNIIAAYEMASLALETAKASEIADMEDK